MSSSMSLSTAFHKNNSNNNIKDISDTKNVNDTMEVGALNQKSASAGVTHSWNRSLLHFNVYNQLQQHLQQQGQQHQTISTPSSPLNTAFSHNALSNKDSEDDVSLHMNTLEAKSSKPMDLNRVSSGSGKDQARTIKKESLKEQKKNYKCEKKRATNELLSTLQDPSIAMLSDWLKVRGSLKSWTKLWCVLKPGMLELYKSCKVKSSHWVATCLLSSCEVIERPSKKDGFCFKLFHHLDQSIWATKGPKGESIGALTLPLPTSYLIFRASSEASGRCWIDALEMALHCSGLLIRSMTKEAKEGMTNDTTPPSHAPPSGEDKDFEACDSDYEKHFKICETDEKEEELKFDSEDDEEEDDEDYQKRKKGRIKTPTNSENGNSPPVESSYGENVVEELGQSGAAFQTEEVADENRSIIWTLVKQVRPGMDLSKVALPTFILEPRSFLDKLSDYYYHADLLSEAVCLDDPYSRMKMVVRWYLSGFYKKPKGLKKPYNPVLGETFRCFWKHHKTSSRTFYIAEQISHHPPVSAFYVTNRQDGFSITGSILAKSKFYGNSLSAILDGVCRLVMLNRGEEYTLTMPYAHCKGILLGTLSMEFGGEVSIQCEKTGYKTELEFKLKPFLGSEEASNKVAGKIKLGNEVLASIDGHWDQEMFIRDKRTMKSETFWNPTLEVKGRRLKRYTILPEAQSEFESEKLWGHVSEAILKGDQRAATDEKCFLEDEQRKNARERKARMLEWTPNLFERNLLTGDWVYKFADWRPWDPLNDVLQFEKDFVISTKTHHQTPIVHTTSITSMEENPLKSKLSHSRNPSLDCATRIHRMKMRSLHTPGSMQGTTPSCQDMPGQHNNDVEGDSESSISPAEISGSMGGGLNKKPKWNKEGGQKSKLASLLVMQQENNEKLSSMQQQLTSLQTQIASASSHCNPQSEGSLFESRAVLFLLVAILLHSFFQAWLK